MQLVRLYRGLGPGHFLTGRDTSVIQFAGCSLRCAGCENSAAQSKLGAMDMSVSAICDRLREFGLPLRYVCLTGGEPLIQDRSELYELLSALGSILVPVPEIILEVTGAVSGQWIVSDRASKRLPRFRLVFFYKLPSTQVEDSMNGAFLHSLSGRDGVVFSCADHTDFTRAVGVLRELAHTNSDPTVFFRHTCGKPVRWLVDALVDLRDMSSRFDIRYDTDVNMTLIEQIPKDEEVDEPE